MGNQLHLEKEGIRDLSHLLEFAIALAKTTPVLWCYIVPPKLVIFLILPEGHLLESWLFLFTYHVMQAFAQWPVD